MSAARYAVGPKTYNGTRSSPNLGPTSGQQGYAQRDLEYKTRKKNTKQRNNALLKRIQARKGKRYMSSENLSTPQGRSL